MVNSYASIHVPDHGILKDINVTIDITHTFNADLDIHLIAPDGTSMVLLSDDNGNDANNYTNTTFDDEAVLSITGGSSPFTGTFKPENPLSSLHGMNILGEWKLQVYDDAVGDIGTINKFEIELVY